MNAVRGSLVRLLCVAALVFASVQGAHAQSGAVEASPELKEMAIVSYFVEKHAWLMDTGLISDRGNPYGIGDWENAALTATVRSMKRELDELQAEAPNYQKEGRGREYFERRRAVLLSGRVRLLQAVASPAWQKISAQLDAIGANLVGTPAPQPASKESAANMAPGDALAEETWMYSTASLGFYEGGLGGRSDSWPEGPNAVLWCSHVNGVKGLLNGGVFSGPWSASACNGARAWAGWTTSNPSPGTYKTEGLHSFWNSMFAYGYPPMPTGQGWPDTPGPCFGVPAPFDSYCDRTNGYIALWSPVDLRLNVAATQEVSKPGHHLVLKNCASPVVVSAEFVPPPPPLTGTYPTISWTGGTAGSDNQHRNVPCTNPGNISVTARVGTNLSATVQVHVIDASPPPSPSQASLNWQNVGSFTPTGFGEAAIQIGNQGVTAPTYDVTAGFGTDRWVFHLESVTHGYKIGLNDLGRQDLPFGNPRPFPIAPLLQAQMPGATIVDAHREARADLDTSGLVPVTTVVGPPRMDYYWVRSVVQDHEQAHIDHFYQPQFQFWDQDMRDFETSDVESPSAAVVYDCSDPNTTSAAAAIASKQQAWDAAIAVKHAAADTREFPSAELYAYRTTNPNFVPIWNAIPTGGAPMISGIRPTSSAPGSSGHIEIYGQELHYNPVITISGTGVALSTPAYISATQINVPYTVATNAPIGPRQLAVETDNGTAYALFTVANDPPAPPHIDAIVPSAAARSSSGYIEIYGDHLYDGYALVSVSGAGVSVTNWYVSSTQINVQYTVDPTAVPGTRTLTVTTSAGASNGVPFTVQ